jgi:hypothetical protein
MEEFFAPFFFFSCRVRRYIPPMAVRDEYRNKNESIMQIGGLADKHAPFKAGDLKSFSSRPAHPPPSKYLYGFYGSGGKSGANPTIAIYNASVVKSYNATSSLERFVNKDVLFSLEKCNSLPTGTTLPLYVVV